MPVPVPVRPPGSTNDSNSSAAQKNIWVAAGEGDLARVQHLVENEGISVTAADQWTYTPLHAAASYAQKDVLRYLLSHPSAPQHAVETTDDDGDTPLFVCEDVSVAKMLVEEYHANAKHENNEGNTPAMAAEENEHVDVAEYLRGVTGEAPLYATLQDLQAQDARAQAGNGAGLDMGMADSDALEEAIDARTDALMDKVQEILRRAEARGAASAEDLNPEEEEELRRAVGESIFTQIREGWGVAGGAPQDDAAQVQTDSHDPDGEADDDQTTNPADASDLPGR